MLVAARAPAATKDQVEIRAADSASLRSWMPRASQPLASQWPSAFEAPFLDCAENAKAVPSPRPTILPAANAKLACLSTTFELVSAFWATNGGVPAGPPAPEP